MNNIDRREKRARSRELETYFAPKESGETVTFTHNFCAREARVRLTPSIDVAISRVCAVKGLLAVSVLYGSNLVRICRVDSGHTVSLLARGSRHYLVVACVFFEVQLERRRSQSDGRVRGRGLE